jgi:hypothetical protein
MVYNTQGPNSVSPYPHPSKETYTFRTVVSQLFGIPDMSKIHKASDSEVRKSFNNINKHSNCT